MGCRDFQTCILCSALQTSLRSKSMISWRSRREFSFSVPSILMSHSCSRSCIWSRRRHQLSQIGLLSSVRKGLRLIILSLWAKATLASDFRSHVAHLLMGKLGGYGACVLGGALRLAGITPMGLHNSAISCHVVLVGTRGMFCKSA